MKRILAVLIVLMLILTVFAACGDKENNVGGDSYYGSDSGSSNADSSKELTSSEIEELWGGVSIEIGTNTDSSNNNSSGGGSGGNQSSGGTSSGTSSGGTSSGTGASSSQTQGASSSQTGSDKDQGFNSWVPLNP